MTIQQEAELFAEKAKSFLSSQGWQLDIKKNDKIRDRVEELISLDYDELSDLSKSDLLLSSQLMNQYILTLEEYRNKLKSIVDFCNSKANMLIAQQDLSFIPKELKFYTVAKDNSYLQSLEEVRLSAQSKLLTVNSILKVVERSIKIFEGLSYTKGSY